MHKAACCEDEQWMAAYTILITFQTYDLHRPLQPHGAHPPHPSCDPEESSRYHVGHLSDLFWVYRASWIAPLGHHTLLFRTALDKSLKFSSLFPFTTQTRTTSDCSHPCL
jgi:hypothetical protein